MKRVIHFATVSALSASCAFASAAGLVQVDDEQLADVSGQDGVYLNLKGFSLKSDPHFGYLGLTLTYTMPYEGANAAEGDPLGLDPTKAVDFIEYGKFSISRTDPAIAANIFADPYQIQIEKIPVNLGWTVADLEAYGFDPANPTEEVIRILNSKNVDGTVKWDMTYDWKVVTGDRKDGVVDPANPKVEHDMGARIVDDLVIRGGGLSLAPALAKNQSPGDARGIAFGLDLNIEIGALILRPRGRDDASSEFALRGIKIGAANDDRTGFHADSTKTWTVADVIMQPGILNAYTDANGKPVLRMGIEWHRGRVGNGTATEFEDPVDLAAFKGQVGAFSVDQIIIKSGTAATPVNLGGLSVGGMEIRYLDVVFRNPY